MSWEETAKYVRERDKVCRRCDHEAKDVHHILSRRLGGRDHPVNLILLCDSCHVEVEAILSTIGLTHYMRRWMVENRYNLNGSWKG